MAVISASMFIIQAYFKLDTDTTTRVCHKTDLICYKWAAGLYTRRAQDGVTKRAQELIFSFSARSKACVHKLISF